MYKFVAYSCMAAAVAYAAPTAEAEAEAEAWHGAGLGYGLGAVGLGAVGHVAAVAPAVHTATITTPKCTLTFEEIESQNCVPKAEQVCDTKDVEQESVTFEKECKEVTSKVCGPHGHIGLIKREAEAEAEAWHGAAGLGLGYGGAYAAAPIAAVAHAPAVAVAAPAALATSHVTIKSDCREVTKEVCVNTPKKVTKTVPVTSCHVEHDVVCTPIVKRIPKKNCEQVETKVAVPVAAPVAVAHHAAPIAAGHLW